MITKTIGLLCLVVATLAHDGNCGGAASRLYNLPAGSEEIMVNTRRALRANAPLAYTNPLASQPLSPINSYSAPIAANLPANENLGFTSEMPSSGYIAPVAPALPLTSTTLPPAPVAALSSINSYPIDNSNLGFSSHDIPSNQNLPASQSLPLSSAPLVSSPIISSLPSRSSLPISANVIPAAPVSTFTSSQAALSPSFSRSEGQTQEPIPVQEPVQEPAQEPIPVQEPVQTQEPIPVQEPQQPEPIPQQPAQEPEPIPVQEPQQPIQEPEPIPVQAPEPVRVGTKTPPPTKGGQRLLTSASGHYAYATAPLTRSVAAATLDLPSGADQISGTSITISFSCQGLAYGYYADMQNQCQIFHICQPITLPTGEFQMQRVSFICPEGTQFDQEKHVCVSKSDENLIPCYMSSRYYPSTAQRFAPPAFYRSITPMGTFFRNSGVKGAPVPIVQQQQQEIIQAPAPIREVPAPAPTKTIPVVQQPVREIQPAPTKTIPAPVQAPEPVVTFRGDVKGRAVRATAGVKGYRSVPAPVKGYRVAPAPIKSVPVIPARKTVVQTRADPVKVPSRNAFTTGTLVNYQQQQPMRAYTFPTFFPAPANLVAPVTSTLTTMTQPLLQPFATRGNLPLSPVMALNVRKN